MTDKRAPFHAGTLPQPPAAPDPTAGEHVIEERGRVYDRCRCGWYGSLGDTHVAASTGTSEDVEVRLRHHLRATTGGLGVADLDALLAAREAAARAEERERIAQAIEAAMPPPAMRCCDGLAIAARIARAGR